VPYTLYYHPLSSFCQKVLVALYESGTPFERQIVDLMDPAERAEFLKLWPIGKFPVLRDSERDLTIPESTIIIEHLARHSPGADPLLPSDPDLAWRVRAQDRFFDLYVEAPMQKIVGDRMRPADGKDPIGVKEARSRLDTAYDLIEAEMASKTWAVGDDFTMADCSAAPALFYANLVQPFEASRPNVKAYFDRLSQRPSFKRVVEEAKPYFSLFPEA
jgi:glutathione S-transferase